MKRFLAAALAALTLVGCKSLNDLYHPKNPYTKRMFYEKYLIPGDAQDAKITETLNGLRANPDSPVLHNELGQLLRAKGFPKDAEREFERAVDADPRFYPAWYNLGLLREARGNYAGARFAFRRSLRYKPGHAAALFQMGLMEEQRHNSDGAIDYYAKAFSINSALLDVHVNPRIIDSKLVDLALLRLYQNTHARQSLEFEPAPQGYSVPQPAASQIVPSSAPLTNPATQTPPPAPKPPL